MENFFFFQIFFGFQIFSGINDNQLIIDITFCFFQKFFQEIAKNLKQKKINFLQFHFFQIISLKFSINVNRMFVKMFVSYFFMNKNKFSKPFSIEEKILKQYWKIKFSLIFRKADNDNFWDRSHWKTILKNYWKIKIFQFSAKLQKKFFIHF